MNGKNLDVWVLFQLYDKIMERWSPVYCAPSQTAIDLEVRELLEKMPNRPITLKILGMMCGGEYKSVDVPDKDYGDAV